MRATSKISPQVKKQFLVSFGAGLGEAHPVEGSTELVGSAHVVRNRRKIFVVDGMKRLQEANMSVIIGLVVSGEKSIFVFILPFLEQKRGHK